MIEGLLLLRFSEVRLPEHLGDFDAAFIALAKAENRQSRCSICPLRRGISGELVAESKPLHLGGEPPNLAHLGFYLFDIRPRLQDAGVKVSEVGVGHRL